MEEEALKDILKQLSEIKSSTLTRKKIMELTKKTVLDTVDMALLFNRTAPTIHVWRKKKIVEAIEINGRFFYTWDVVAALLNKKTH